MHYISSHRKAKVSKAGDVCCYVVSELISEVTVPCAYLFMKFSQRDVDVPPSRGASISINSGRLSWVKDLSKSHTALYSEGTHKFSINKLRGLFGRWEPQLRRYRSTSSNCTFFENCQSCLRPVN
jgi:hypothetical protein